jgi:hypothetical protein
MNQSCWLCVASCLVLLTLMPCPITAAALAAASVATTLLLTQPAARDEGGAHE